MPPSDRKKLFPDGQVYDIYHYISVSKNGKYSGGKFFFILTKNLAAMKNWIRLAGYFLVMAVMFSCSTREEYVLPEDSDLQLKRAQSGDATDDRYIVMFRDDVTDPQGMAETMKNRYGFRKGHVYEHVFKGFSAAIPEQAMEGLRHNPHIALIEPDLVMTTCTQTLPTGIRRFAADQNEVVPIDEIADSPDVDVAVVDTGVDKEHADLTVAGGIRYYLGFLSDSNYDDDNGHGSHVAGTIGAKDNDIGVVGVCPGARIWAVKVLNSRGSGYLSDIIAGLNWVSARSADIEVVNMSLGGTGGSTAYRTAIQSCVDKGIVVVVAAGNDTRDVYGTDGKFGTTDDIVPASYPEAMTISALADTDGQPGGTGSASGYGPDDSFASFSNFSRSVVVDNPVKSPGNAIDLLLPGVSILSCYKDANYATMSGTSMASPHGAGLAALYIVKNGRASDADGVYAIRQALIDGGKSQTSIDGLKTLNDPDGNLENLGWAALTGGTVPPANKPPVAIFTAAASGLTVNFTDNSTDSDGSIVAWAWSFGDGGTSTAQNPVHTYASAGTKTVTLTVTDDEGATANVTNNVTVTAPSGDIVLNVTWEIVKNKMRVTLTWTGGNAPYIVKRNGTTIATVSTITYTNNLTKKGTYTYQVCDAKGCSEEKVVVFQ